MDLAIPVDPTVRLRGLRRVEFERLVDAGDLEDAQVELLDGALVEMSPQGSRHAWAIRELGQLLTIGLAGRFHVSQEKPLAIDDLSEPEPDLAVIDPTGPEAHPTTAHVVIEVAETSQAIDLGWKAAAYAGAGIPAYYVVDLPARAVVQHTDPTDDRYATVVTLGPDDRLDVLGVVIDLTRLLSPE